MLVELLKFLSPAVEENSNSRESNAAFQEIITELETLTAQTPSENPNMNILGSQENLAKETVGSSSHEFKLPDGNPVELSVTRDHKGRISKVKSRGTGKRKSIKLIYTDEDKTMSPIDSKLQMSSPVGPENTTDTFTRQEVKYADNIWERFDKDVEEATEQ